MGGGVVCLSYAQHPSKDSTRVQGSGRSWRQVREVTPADAQTMQEQARAEPGLKPAARLGFQFLTTLPPSAPPGHGSWEEFGDRLWGAPQMWTVPIKAVTAVKAG